MYVVALATDYDGTLAEDGVVSPATVAALERFRKTGRRLVPVAVDARGIDRVNVGDMTSVMIRALDPWEWETFRDFRLGALKASPGVFAMSYEEELTRTPEMWRNTVKGQTHQVFGLFDDDTLIGITGVFSWWEDTSGETAIFVMSFILPSHRGRHLSRMFYEARIQWVREHRRFKRIIVSHRESNEVSKFANQRHGFLQTHRLPHTWPDGTTEDEIFYELTISN